MRHRVDTFKIGRTSAHRRSMMANMVSSLFMHGEITTTEVKAKAARRLAEKMVTMGKKGDLHRRRLAVARLRDKDAVKKLFDEIAPAFADRAGGYTRIYKLGVRIGDSARMCILKLVNEEVPVKPAGKTAAKAVKNGGKAASAKKAAPKTAEPEDKDAEAVADATAQVIADPKVESAADHSEIAGAMEEGIPGDKQEEKGE